MLVWKGNEVTVLFAAAMNQPTRANGLFYQLIRATAMKTFVCIFFAVFYMTKRSVAPQTAFSWAPAGTTRPPPGPARTAV
jgi:hypothetical protein